MKFLDILKTNSKVLDAKLEASKSFVHRGTKGTIREEDLISVIRDCIPNCYGLKAGEIFDQYGSISKQIDVVIYDNVYSNYFKRESSSSLFPCESIYGSIEVKSFLNKDEFDKSIENIKSVRSLKRESSNMLDITPLRRLEIDEKSFRISGDGNTNQNEYVNIIFAYDGVKMDTMLDYISDLKDDIELLPTFIYIYKQGIIYSKVELKSDNYGRVGMNHIKNHTYSISQYGDDSMSAFFMLLNALLEQIILKSINYTDFSNKCLNHLKKEEDNVLISKEEVK